MSGGIEALQLKEEDVVKLLAAGVHLGASNVDFQMENYVYKRKTDGKIWKNKLFPDAVSGSLENKFAFNTCKHTSFQLLRL